MNSSRVFRWGLTGICIFFTCFAAELTLAETLAVLPFENNSMTTPERYGPLAKGFAAMLTTDIRQKTHALKMVERTRIDALLKELKLGMTGTVDEETAVRAGKILGAQLIAFGSFMVLEEEVRMDTRIIRVETSEVIAAESVTGPSSTILSLLSSLAEKIAASLKTSGTSSQANPEKQGKLDAALYFSRGLEALDQGFAGEAKEWFEKCLKSDRQYDAQIKSLYNPQGTSP